MEAERLDGGGGLHGAASLIGARLADRFVVERRLGEGGMGIVYEALDEQRGERVALKTLDKMLVEPLAPDRNRSVAGAAGTPGYMAPEQLAEGGACPESDWYAVGTMLYESLTGRLPFTGSAMEVLAAKFTRREPVLVSTLCPSAPADLAELASELLRARPQDRADAARIIAVASSAGVAPALATTSAPRVRAAGRAPFVGREAELARLHDAFAQTRRGQPTIVLLEGLSGIGKSVLVERFVDDVRRDGDAVVLSGRCYERESVPFKALDAVIDALSRYLRELDDVAAARLTPRDVPELCRVFPVLARVPALAGTVPARAAVPDPHEVRRRAFLALKEILARIADGRPLIVTIDDLQWGDVDSGLLLTQLISPPDPPQLLLIGSYRADEVARSELLKMLREHAERTREHVETLVLQPLDTTNARDLATVLLRERGIEPSPEVVAAIASEAAGSPFFIAELARADHEATAPSLPELLANRIAELPSDARRLLELVSIAGGPLPRQVALRAAGLDTADDAGIPLLTSASLVRGSGAGEDASLETYHDRIRETVVAGLDADRARAHHLALAEVLAARPDPPAEQLALHYREGGRREEARLWTHRAAERAVDAMAFDRAADLYRLALDLMPKADEAARRRIQVQQGDALANAGRGAKAADAYLEAARGAPHAEGIDLERRAAYELLGSGRVDRGLELSDRVAKRVGIWIPRYRLLQYAVATCGLLYLYLRGVPRHRRTLAEVSDETRLRIDVGQSLTTALSYVDTMRAAVLGSISLVRALRAGEPTRIGLGLLHACWIFAGLLRPKNPRIALWSRTIEELGRSESDPTLSAYASFATGIATFCGGSWRVARDALADTETKLERCHLVANERHHARALYVGSLFYLGQLRTFAERLPVFTKEARASGNLWALHSLVCAAGPAVWLAADDVITAEQEVEEARRALPSGEFQHHLHLIARMLILFYRGDKKESHELIEREWATLKRSGLLFVHVIRQEMLALRANAAVAAACGEPDAKRARPILAGAARHARNIARNLVTGSDAWAAEIDAGVALARGMRSVAVERLSFAVNAFTEAEMMMYAASARRRLGQLRGGDEGRELIAEADAFMKSEGIVKPDRFAAMLAPGFPD